MRITFDEFCQKLAQGQLKNTNATDDSRDGLLLPEREDQILSLMNQGLQDITTKKKLFEDQKSLTLVKGTNLYTLGTGVGEDFENLVRVLEIIDIDERRFSPKSNAHITMPDWETLRFSTTFVDNHYKNGVDIKFQKKHPEVTLEGEINLPGNLHEALVLYVSGLYLAHKGGEAHKAQGDSYYGLYLKMLNDETVNNSAGTSEVVDEDTRFADRGFV